MSKSTVTAVQVREFFAGNEARIARLPESVRSAVTKDASGNFPKGRLPDALVEAHNKARRNVQYVSGATTEANKARTAARAEAVAQGLAGKRGPVKGSKPKRAKAAKPSQTQPKG